LRIRGKTPPRRAGAETNSRAAKIQTILKRHAI